jgi:nucleoside-diphosphate-sugar epimerase
LFRAGALTSFLMRVAVTGASGKTGWRVVDEALKRGFEVVPILRVGSQVPQKLAVANLELKRLELTNQTALVNALTGCDALVIATGARPSIDLAGPLKVDALGIRAQIAACKKAGVKKVVLISSLCSGRVFHPLNLFGLILLWKRLGEHWLSTSGLEWTIIRPGGLKETEEQLEWQGIRYSGADQQESSSIPRRLVAQVCIEAIPLAAAVGRIIEITSAENLPPQALADWLALNPA